LGAPYFAVIDLQHKLGVGHVEVSDKTSMPLGMNRRGFGPALMAKRCVPQVRRYANKRRRGIFVMNVLVQNFHSLKWEIPCYTKTGHYATPFFYASNFWKRTYISKDRVMSTNFYSLFTNFFGVEPKIKNIFNR
jgi:hypothetical protein